LIFFELTFANVKIISTFAFSIGKENEFYDFSRLIVPLADVAKLVDALDLGSSAARHGGSSPSIRTNVEPSITQLF
jgi:hypothetical protein